MSKLLAVRPKIERNIELAIWAGIVAGVISALVKSGFETMIPPRTLSTTPPPVVPVSYTHLTLPTSDLV